MPRQLRLRRIDKSSRAADEAPAIRVSVDKPQDSGYSAVGHQQEKQMPDSKTDVPQGALDLLVLKTLQAMGPMHGWGVARRIEQVSENALHMNQGTIYPALVRLEQQGWITSEWGTSENKRRARFYALTPKGRRQLAAEERRWDRISAIVARFRQPLLGEEGR